MTEAEWLVADNPVAMAQSLHRRKFTSRKKRLFACACYRHIPQFMTCEPVRRAVEVSERYADGLATNQELVCHFRPALTQFQEADYALWHRLMYSLPTARRFEECRHEAVNAAKDGSAERAYQAAVIRDLIGNPFRLASLDQRWKTATVDELARTMRADGDFDRLPILADALEDAGCTNRDILDHCRQPGEHVRGCWVVDLVLGRS